MADDIIGPPLPEIISHAEAKAAGLKRYFTGKPCKHGHLAERWTTMNACVECTRLSSSAPHVRGPINEQRKADRLAAREARGLKPRAAAKAAGLPRYFTGKPCPLGHVSERLVSTRRCVECSRLTAAAWKADNVDRVAAHRAARYQANGEQERAYQAARRATEEGRARANAATAKWRKNNPPCVTEQARQLAEERQRRADEERRRRADARAAGLKVYSSGVPCTEGHGSERRVSNRQCVVCYRVYTATKIAARSADRKARRDAIHAERQAQSERPIVTRAEARAAGMVRYFPGIPCDYGHVEERFVKNGCCIVCAKSKHEAWRAANPEKMKAASAAWATNNPDKVHANSVAYYAKNPELRRQRSKEWREANPDKLKGQGQTRRGRERAAEGVYTAEDVKRIYQAQRGKCAYCKTKVGKTYHVDHIQPVSKGGSNWPANLQILCPPCNCRKKDRDPIKHMRSLGRLL